MMVHRGIVTMVTLLVLLLPGLSFRRNCVFAADQRVSARDGHTAPDGTLQAPGVDDSDADLRTLQDGAVFLRSKTFKPPTGWIFQRFGPSPATHVDIILSNVAGLSANRWTDEDTAIDIRVSYPAGTNAGEFPLECEGNLSPTGGGGGGGGTPPQKCWGARIKDQQAQRLHIIAGKDYTFRTTHQASLHVKALNAAGQAQAGVSITITVAGDKSGQLPSFLSGTTRASLMGGDPELDLSNATLPLPDQQDTKYTVTATANGYQQDQVVLSIVGAQWVERDAYKGFDGSESPPWLVVGVNRTSTGAMLQLDQAISGVVGIAVTDTARATITPASTSAAQTNTGVTGKQHAVTTAKATQNGDLAVLSLDVKNARTMDVRMIFVKDTAGHDGTISNADAIFSTSQGMWGDQAVVDLRKLDNTLTETWTINKDIGVHPTTDNIAGDIATAQRAAPGANQVFIYIVPGLSMAVGDAGGETRGQVIYVQSGVQAAMYAHEIGHALGFASHSHDPNDVMYPAVGGQRVCWREADAINP